MVTGVRGANRTKRGIDVSVTVLNILGYSGGSSFDDYAFSGVSCPEVL